MNISYNITNLTENVTCAVQQCLWVNVCMPVHECQSKIQEYIFPKTSEWVFIVLYFLLFIFGLLGNSLVCYVIWTSQHMQTVVNIFIFNLAVADFLVILFCLPPTMLADVTESWYLGEIMCRVVPFIQTTSVSVSVLTLTAISVERYYAICHPLRVRLKSRTITITIIIIWIIGIIVATPDLIFRTLIKSHAEYITHYLKYCKRDWEVKHDNIYHLFIVVALYSIPICLMACTYSIICRHLWKKDLPGTSESENRRPLKLPSLSSPENQLCSRRRAAKMLMTIVVVFAVCYLPVHILNLIRYTESFKSIGVTLIPIIALISHILCYFNSAINPVIYNFMSAKFRKEFQMALSCCRFPLIGFRGLGTSSGRNKSTNIRSDRYTTQHTVSTRQGWLFTNSAMFRKASCPLDKYG